MNRLLQLLARCQDGYEPNLCQCEAIQRERKFNFSRRKEATCTLLRSSPLYISIMLMNLISIPEKPTSELRIPDG